MATSAKNITFAILLWCGYAQASQRCGSAALYDQSMAAADAQMGPFVLFRGEIEALPREDKRSSPPSGTSCCVDKACPNVLCSAPSVKLTPPMFLDYAVTETLWGEATKPLIHAWYEAVSPCGQFNPVLHAKVITYCSSSEGWAGNVFTWCQRPIADTEENLRRVRAWIPQAMSRQVRKKMSEEEAQSHLIYKVSPVLPKVDPPLTKDRAKGDVVVRIFINRSGTVRSLRAISGPPQLTQSAVNAVSLWRFKPFSANGRLIKVDTTVTVHF